MRHVGEPEDAAEDIAYLRNMLRLSNERVKELEREKDHANMVADSAVEKIKELEDALRAADGYENGIIREFEEDRVKELEAHLRKIHDRAHSWNNIPACSDIAEHHARPERT